MTVKEQALEHLEQAEFPAFFHLAEQYKTNPTLFAELQEEFVSDRFKANFNKRLQVFAQSYLPDTPLRAYFLTDFYKMQDFIGREKDLKALDKLLKAQQPTVLVNGLGGVGKTALAKKYIEKYKKDYQHILWLEQQSSLLNTFINAEYFIQQLQLQQVEEAKRFKRIMEHLQGKKGKNLLIIDNFENTSQDEEQQVLKEFRNIRLEHWSILFTSREEARGFRTLELDTLPQEEAIKLFHQYCPNKEIDDDTLQRLLELIDYHTLTLELLAKNYANSWDFDNLEQLITTLEQEGLDAEFLQEAVEIQQSPKEVKLYTYLTRIFKIEDLGEEAKYILKQFAVLPSQPILGKQLLEWIGDEERKYKETIKTLAQKGWLQTENKQDFEMHHLIQMLMLKVLQPTLQDCNNLVDTLTDLLDPDKVAANPLALQYLGGYAEALLEHLDFQEALFKKVNLQNILARLYENLGFYAQAEQFYQLALEIEKERVGKQHQDYATILNNLALVYEKQGKYTEAEKFHQESLEIKEATIGKKHPDYAITLNNLALVYDHQGKYEEAEKFYQESLQIKEATIGKKHPDYAITLNNLALVYDHQGKYEEAEKFYQESLQIKEATIGKKHPDYAITLNNLALVYRKQGKYEEAEKLYQESLQIKEASIGKKHPDYAMTLNNLALVYDHQGKYAAAETLYQESLSIYQEIVGANHPIYAQVLHNLGALYYEMEEYLQAEKFLNQAYEIRLETLGEEHPDTQSTQEWLEAAREKLKGS